MIYSNMGFKISLSLVAGNQNNWVSLPYYNSFATSTDVRTDLANAGFTGVVVSRFDPTIGIYTNDGGRNPFTIIPGEALLIKVTTETGQWVAVGSHNPSLALTLTVGDNNYVSVPYHTTATSAATLFGQIPNCYSISRFDNTTQAYVDNYGSPTINNFSLQPGEGLVITVSSTCTWKPQTY